MPITCEKDDNDSYNSDFCEYESADEFKIIEENFEKEESKTNRYIGRILYFES